MPFDLSDRAAISLSVVIAVNIVGFDIDAPNTRNELGMVSMRERIRSVGGTISFSSKPSLGTQIETAIPMANQAVAATATG